MGVNYKETGDVLDDSIDDEEIDFGTGSKQVNLDDIPDGVATYARILAGYLSSGKLIKIADAGGNIATVSLTGADRILTLSADVKLNQDVDTSASPTFAAVNF